MCAHVLLNLSIERVVNERSNGRLAKHLNNLFTMSFFFKKIYHTGARNARSIVM